MVTGNRLILSTILITTTTMVLKLSSPTISSFITSDIPYIWSLALYYHRPPYLYLLINCIILSIVASNKLSPRGTTADSHEYPFPSVAPERLLGEEAEEEGREEMKASNKIHPRGSTTDSRYEAPERGLGDEVEVVFGCVEERDDEMKATNEVHPRGIGSTLTPVKMRDEEEKPLVSSRFSHRRSVKASHEGRSPLLKVSRPKKQETLDATWQTMTGGRPIPLTRHLKKSDTFTATSSQHTSSDHAMKKSETFSGAGKSPPVSSSGGKIRREPSLSQDELNRRVEAFIKKFNEEMRLQRQESLSQYKEMVKRGAH